MSSSYSIIRKPSLVANTSPPLSETMEHTKSRTTSKVSTLEHSWIVENFKQWHLGARKEIYSAPFYATDCKFRMKLVYAGKDAETGRVQFRLYLNYRSEKLLPENSRFAVKLSVVDEQRVKQYTQDFKVKALALESSHFVCDMYYRTRDDDVRDPKLPKLLSNNDSVTLNCELTFVTECDTQKVATKGKTNGFKLAAIFK